jgi:hypothetical protein
MDRLFFILILVCLAIILLLFCPIYLKTDTHYDMNGRRLAFSLSLYKMVRVFGGYIATYPGGLAMHVSPKKAVLIPYSNLDSERKRISIVRTFRLKALNITVETGAEYLIAVSFMQILFRILFFAMGGQKEKIENNLWLTDGDILRISANFTVRFNLFIILKSLLSKLKEK